MFLFIFSADLLSTKEVLPSIMKINAIIIEYNCFDYIKLIIIIVCNPQVLTFF